MAILNIVTQTPGLVGVLPSPIYINTNDTLAEVTVTGYLNGVKGQGYSIAPKQFAHVYTTDYGVLPFQIDISGSNVSLIQMPNPGYVIVTLPVTNNHVAVFDGTTGKIKDGGHYLAEYVPIVGPSNTILNNASTNPGEIASFEGSAAFSANLTGGRVSGVSAGLGVKGLTGTQAYATFSRTTVQGTTDPTSDVAGVYGQLDLSTATVNQTRIAPLFGDFGPAGATIVDARNIFGTAITNTSGITLAAQDYRYGDSAYYYMGVAASTPQYLRTAGTSPGSAGDPTKCNASDVLIINIQGLEYWIPLFNSNA